MKARENPFRVEKLHQLSFRLPGMSLEQLQDRFEELGKRAAIVGADGTGKTTLFEQFVNRLHDRGRVIRAVRLSLEDRRLPGDFISTKEPIDSETTILAVDGADHLRKLDWRQLRRRSGRYQGLLITSHRPGMLPTLSHCKPSLELLDELVAELVPEQKKHFEPILPDLYKRHCGNIRECLRELYDRNANL